MGFRYSVEVQTLSGGLANFYVFDRDANQGRGRTLTSLGAFGTFDAALEMAESMEDTAGRPEREVRKVGCLDCRRTWITGKPAPVCDICGSEFVAAIIDVEETVVEDNENENTEYAGKGWTPLPNTPGTNAMYPACGSFRELKDSAGPCSTNSEAERMAFTHALRCPTCKPLADAERARLADKIARLEAEIAAEKRAA